MNQESPDSPIDADPRDRLIDAMLVVVAKGGWAIVTLDGVAAAAGMPAAEAKAQFGDRAALLQAFADRVDAAACAEAEPQTDDAARYDALLDILMQRFEILQKHRTAVLRLLRDVPTDPCTLLRCLPQSQRAFRGIAGAAGYPDRGLSGVVMGKALLAVWLVVQRDWLRDETPDLSVTMASLDRHLGRALGFLGSVVRRGDTLFGQQA